MAESSLSVVRVPGKGRGVVATRPLAGGEVVESTPVIVIPAREWTRVHDTVLSSYCFDWDESKGSVAVALGLTSLLNHSYSPNVGFEKKLASRRIVFFTLRDVEAGEELTLNYNGDHDNRDPVWFDVK